MIKNWLILPFLLLMFLVTSCQEEPISVQYGDTNNTGSNSYKRTVLVYIAGDNSLSSFAFKDLAEMKQGMQEADATALHLLVYLDTGDSPRLVELKKSGDTVVEEVVREYEDRNSCGLEETREVFDAVFSNPNFEAESYGLIYCLMPMAGFLMEKLRHVG